MTVKIQFPLIYIAILVFGILMTVSSAVVAQEIHENFDSAMTIAKEENKPVLLIFAGSDWCLPCVRLEKEVLNSDDFKHYIAKNIVVMMADFPQRSRQSKELKEQNEILAERYNPTGVFPFILLLNSEGEILAEITYAHQNAEEFIATLESRTPRETSCEYSKNLLLMGSAFNLKFITQKGEHEASVLMGLVVAEIERIESMISSWDSTSETALINRQAGIAPVQVSDELYGLIERSIQISKLTQGAFDITFSGVYSLYNFDRQEHELPDREAIDRGIAHISWQRIKLLDNNRVFLPEKGMSIGFGAIGKGFAADKAKKLLLAHGVKSGVINASGDLTTWGKSTHEDDRKVGIADPVNSGKILAWIPISDRSVATSGDYEKYFTHQAERYAHIIDPKTGLPVTHTRSVTIISTSAELSDALATAVFVLGYRVGVDLINQLDGVECFIIDKDMKFHFSEGLKYYDTEL